MIYRSVLVFLFMGLFTACGRDFDKPGAPQVTLLNGRVLTDNSQPVNGARVRLLECGISTLTGPDGRFSIENVPNGDYIISADAQVEVEGKPMDLVMVRSEPEPLRGAVRDLPYDLVLQETGEVRGSLSSNDYSSPVGALVYIEAGSSMASVSGDGGFVLKVPAGKWQIGASKAGYQLVQAAEKKEVEVQAGGTISLDLQLEPIPQDSSAGISGLVYLSNPGPEKGVEVVLSDLFASIEYKTFTDANGVFSLSGIPAGLYELKAKHDGYRSVGLSLLPLRDGDEVSLERPLILPRDDQGGTTYPWDDDPTGNIDDDGDGIEDAQDNCPVVYNPDQMDWDADGVGNVCDTTPGVDLVNDPDGDGVLQAVDNCPDLANPDQANSDLDPLGDACDPDDDNDGWLDEQDRCPQIADALNDPSLCNWDAYLVYSAQEKNSGDIYLYRAETQNGRIVSHRLNTGQGQSWGATVSDAGWIFYHHRPGEDQAFSLCFMSIEDLDASPVCFVDWQWSDGQSGDVMNPSVCNDGSKTWLFYERYVIDNTRPGWRIYATQVPLDAAQTTPGAQLVLSGDRLHQTPSRPLLNFRYPSCHYDGNSMTLAHSVDFLENTDIADLTMHWSTWYVGVLDGVANSAIMPIPSFGGDMNGAQQLRAAWMPDGWVYEQKEGVRVDLYTARSDFVTQLVVDGSRNLHPAFLMQGLNPTQGLVAYQSDLEGSYDLYLLRYPQGTPVKVTHVSGWAGSPTWYPNP